MDKCFYVEWEDVKKRKYKVAILARINHSFYLKYRSEDSMQEAYKNGFREIPSFTDKDRLYKSDTQLFDFFKQRIPPIIKETDDPCELLRQTRGKSMTDSFFVVDLPTDLVKYFKKIILELDSIQSERNQSKEEK